jgi:ParB family chromosome partitioning protein
MPQRTDAKKPAKSRRRLGRGLESLMSSPVSVDISSAPAECERPKSDRDIRSDSSADELGRAPGRPLEAGVQPIALSTVRPNPNQPRRDFDEAALEGLAQSIRSAGMMQPIVVRPHGPGGYEIVAGERRYRAATMIGLAEIPAIIRDIDDATAAELSLIENIQREDLNPIERAEAFRRLVDEFGLTHQEVAERVALDRTSITNHLRLLELDESTIASLRSGRLSMGHGRALLAITNPDARRTLAEQAASRAWSVRELERRVRSHRDGTQAASASRSAPVRPAHMEDLERRLGEHLGTRVALRSKGKKGAGDLIISFYSLDEFEGLLTRLGFQYE